MATLIATVLLSAHSPAIASWPSGTQAPTLYGVTIGENAVYALADLGRKPPRWKAVPHNSPQPQAEYRFALADYGRALLELVFDTRIKSIMVVLYGSKQSSITDPYGIRINDLIARLTHKRGQPDAIDARHDYVYASLTRLHWAYGTSAGKVTSISVSD